MRFLRLLLLTFCRLPQWGISEHFTVNQAQMLIEALHLIEQLQPPLRQTAVSRSPFILSASLVLLALFRYTNPLRCLSSLLIHLNAQKIVERVLVREHSLRYESLEPF